MSLDLQSLDLVTFTNYTSVVTFTAVTYDYILTLSREIEYIWRRPWTWASTIFVVVRYTGLPWVIFNALVGSSFLPGPVNVSMGIYLATTWAFPVFLSAADFMMILRVYAMWNRSKKILHLFLFIYIVQTILFIVFVAIYNIPNTNLSATVLQVQGLSYCSVSMSASWSAFAYPILIPRCVLSVLLFLLVLLQTFKESVEMYKETKQWEPNRYFQHLARDGIVYFAMNMFYNVMSIFQGGLMLNNNAMLIMTMLSYISMCPMMPRFIISVRELYDRDTRSNVYGIDVGFGIGSQLDISQDTTTASIAFSELVLEKEESAESPVSMQSEVMRGDEGLV